VLTELLSPLTPWVHSTVHTGDTTPLNFKEFPLQCRREKFRDYGIIISKSINFPLKVKN